MATKKELRGEIARLTELNQKIRKKCLIAFHAMHEAQHEIARMKRQMEVFKHAHAMATSVGCTSKAFRDYWDYCEQRGGE